MTKKKILLPVLLLAALAFVLPGCSPAPKGDAPYIVVDLSAGCDAPVYPISTLSSAPSGGWSDEYKTTKMVFRRIPAGTFVMGSPKSEPGHNPEEVRHDVTLSSAYYIGVFEVTQKQWELVAGAQPSWFRKQGDTRPVEAVSYEDIRGEGRGSSWPEDDGVDSYSFLGRLRSKTGVPFDLPTEAQWENACRAGTETALGTGEDIGGDRKDDAMGRVARYAGSVRKSLVGLSKSQVTGIATDCGTAAVGSYEPNAWGLYDMHGNVWEWCRDWYGDYDLSDATDPVGIKKGARRIERGGSWYDQAGWCRSATRTGAYPYMSNGNLGFRLSCPAGAWISQIDAKGSRRGK
jgi:formylglycine-generating enzyme required for sulfatase activity